MKHNHLMHNSVLQGQCRKTVSYPDKLICPRFLTISRPSLSLSVQSQVYVITISNGRFFSNSYLRKILSHSKIILVKYAFILKYNWICQIEPSFILFCFYCFVFFPLFVHYQTQEIHLCVSSRRQKSEVSFLILDDGTTVVHCAH